MIAKGGGARVVADESGRPLGRGSADGLRDRRRGAPVAAASVGVETKACRKCCIVKPSSEFYARTNKCKSCTCADVRANRIAKADYYRAFDRQRSKLPHRVKANKLRRLTARGKELRRAEQARERSLRRDAYLARNAVNNAVRDGRLIKEPCEICGTTETHGHHDDYSKPLEVRWLCSRHHTDVHRNPRSMGALDPDCDPAPFAAVRPGRNPA